MRAIQITDYGTNDVLREVQIELPVPKPGEVRVKVHAAGMNPVDYKIRGGAGARFGMTLPIVLGSEAAGTVDAVGDGVTGLAVGDAVYGMIRGSFAEYAVAGAEAVAPVPAGMDLVTAAAVPLAAMTAWQALFDRGGLTAGQRVLITGASGGVGSMGVQLAKAKGATVIATASGRNADFVRSLGADEFVDYTEGPFEDRARGVDVVFDAVGGDTFERAFKTLRPGGRMVTIVAFPPATLPRDDVTTVRSQTAPNADELRQITAYVEQGVVCPHVETVLPLSDVRRAFELSEAGRTRGKIVVRVA